MKRYLLLTCLCLLFFASTLVYTGVANTSLNFEKLGFKKLQNHELEPIIGAAIFSDCTGSSACDSSWNTCTSVSCETKWTPVIVRGIPVNVPYCDSVGSNGGCDTSGSYTICEAALCLYCSPTGGSGRCGQYRVPLCETLPWYSPTYGCSGETCMGFCTDYTSEGSCKHDCS